MLIYRKRTNKNKIKIIRKKNKLKILKQLIKKYLIKKWRYKRICLSKHN